MSRRNRHRYRNRYQESRSQERSVDTGSSSSSSPALATSQAAEYKIISRDLARLVILNTIILAGLLVVFFTNRSSGYLEQLFQQLF